MLKNLNALLIGASVVLCCSNTASAAALFNNNPSDTHGGGNNPMSLGHYVAQNFSLSSAYNLTGFTYNAYTRPNTLPVTFVNLNIYTDNSGSVGSLLHSGSFSLASSAVTGSDGYYTFKDFSVNLPNWSLNAGNYFLALNVGPNQYDMHWTIPTSGFLAGGSYISSTGAPGSFTPYSWEHDFVLTGDVAGAAAAVPEPSTWAMMLVGFGAIGFAMRKQRQTVNYSFA
jgi:hypothetical protein